MPEIIADNISIVETKELEGAARLDAEYYQPEYLNIEGHLLNTANYKLWKDINGRFITGPFGSSFNVENYVSYPPYRYIRGKDVKDFFLLDDDNVYIPEKDYERLKKYILYEGDILVSVVGTLGNAVIVDKNNIPSVFSCKSTAFRTNTLNPFFLIAYLNCLFGKKLLQRKVRGAVQTGLNIDDLKLLPIYLPNTESQNKIAKLVIDAKNNLEQSKVLYSQAESLLLEELGIKDIDLSHEPCYEVNSADTISANRIDAEYYQPKYERVIEAIENSKYGWCKLPDRITNIIDKYDPYKEQERNFRYIELSNINPSIGVIDDYLELKGKDLPSRARMLIREGDVIISSVEGSIDKVALVDNIHDGCIASTGFFVFRANENTLPEYALVLCKSILIQKQLEKLSSGTILAAVPKNLVETLIIPDVPIEAQKEIANLIRQSHSARRQAKELLEQAKQKVEEMIEKGTLNGMRKRVNYKSTSSKNIC